MKRRDFLGMVANLALANAAAHAQQPATKKRLAVIILVKMEDAQIGRDPHATVFLEELQRLGYVEGVSIVGSIGRDVSMSLHARWSRQNPM